MNLLENIALVMLNDAAAAATTGLDGTLIVDTQDWDGIVIVAALGDVTTGSVLTLKGQGNTGNSTTGMADFTGASCTFTAGATSADLKFMAVDIHKPSKRYVRSSFTRTTANAVVNGIFGILYKGAKVPAGLIKDLIAAATVTG